jgi:hypothetical protein
MIISHRHKYIFFAIPKTGTHAVRQALRAGMGEEDLEQVGLFVDKRFPFPEFAGIRHGHLSAQQIRPVLGDATYDAYTKFGFVRNPFDRFVSYCAFMSRGQAHMQARPLDFMKWIVRDHKPVDHILYQPQHLLLTDAAGRLDIDIVGRNETMQASYDAICARIGIPSAPLERVNASEHRPWRDYYDRELRELVAGVYARDLELFDYSFDGP